MSRTEITLATIGSMTLTAFAEDGRLDIVMKSELASIRPSLGLTVMFDELDNFQAQVGAALAIAKPKRRPLKRRGGGKK